MRTTILFLCSICIAGLTAMVCADDAAEQGRLAEILPKDSVVWLELENQKSLAVYRRAVEKNSKGTVIVVKSAIGDISPNAALLDDLAIQLALSYWHTLLVYVPPVPDTNGQKRLEAAVAFLQKGGEKNITLIMADRSAALLTLLINGKVVDTVFSRLILLDADNQAEEVKQPFMEILDPKVAMLDLPMDAENDAYIARQKTARQRNFKHYQLLSVPAPSQSVVAGNEWIIKRIQSWLKKS